jgi:hypothetical protein
MTLTEEQVIDKIEIVGDYRHVQVRTATVIKRDGVEISRSYHRHVVSPDADIKNEDALVKSVCALVHTDKVKTDYAKMRKEQESMK